MTRRRITSACLAALLVGALLAPSGFAAVPRANRVVNAVAKANRTENRDEALRYSLTLLIEGEPVAKGELISHPTGLARLELRTGELVERHLLQGDEHSAARNGRLLASPRAFLPPLFFLQAASSSVLQAALTAFGVERDLVGLMPCGEGDCFVLGDPNNDIRSAELAPTTEGSEAEEHEVDRFAARGASSTGPVATLWVDTETFDVMRIESSAGVVVEFGPYIAFEKMRAPEWWAIAESGKRPVRFEVRALRAVNAPAAAFGKDWMLAPIVAEESPAAGPIPHTP